jgi:hypothetical protein
MSVIKRGVFERRGVMLKRYAKTQTGILSSSYGRRAHYLLKHRLAGTAAQPSSATSKNLSFTFLSQRMGRHFEDYLACLQSLSDERIDEVAFGYRDVESELIAALMRTYVFIAVYFEYLSRTCKTTCSKEQRPLNHK